MMDAVIYDAATETWMVSLDGGRTIVRSQDRFALENLLDHLDNQE